MTVPARLTTAANGFADLFDLSLRSYLWLSLLLRVKYRFSREGHRVIAPSPFDGMAGCVRHVRHHERESPDQR